MNNLPPFDNTQLAQSNGNFTDGWRSNLTQLYQTLNNFDSLINVAGTSKTMGFDNNYVAMNSGLTTFLLPARCPFGSFIGVFGYGSGGWTITQNANQNILWTTFFTTTGTGGSLSSTAQGDCVLLFCVVQNLNFMAVNYIGSLAVV